MINHDDTDLLLIWSLHGKAVQKKLIGFSSWLGKKKKGNYWRHRFFSDNKKSRRINGFLCSITRGNKNLGERRYQVFG